MKAARLLISPAALCIWAICLCIAFSIVGSYASRTIVFQERTQFGDAKVSFPVHMKRWDEPLYELLARRARSEMAEFLKGAERQAAARHESSGDESWKPYSQSSILIEQFRSLQYVSYLQVETTLLGEAEPSVTFRTINFDKSANRQIALGDVLEGADDMSKTLEALSAYARADLRDRTGETDEEESESLLDLAKPDLGIYERFTFCPSTQIEKAAGLTIHFPPPVSGPYAGNHFHVTIPYTVFAKFLKPNMKAFFAGEPRQAPVSLDTET